MPTEKAALLPLHDFLAQLSAWQDDPSDDRLSELRSTFERITSAYGVRGAHLTVDVPPLAPLEVGTGSLAAWTSAPPTLVTEREIEDPNESSPPVQPDSPQGAWLETVWNKFPIHGGCSIGRYI